MKAFGGNSGYIGYSESVRSYTAKQNGEYPKTTFKKEYGISEKKFQELLKREFIEEVGWHHTSKYGNKTTFYTISSTYKALFFVAIGDIKEGLIQYKKSKIKVAVKLAPKKKERFYYQINTDDTDTIDYILSIGGVQNGRTSKAKLPRFNIDKNLLQYKRYRELFLIKEN
jgi:hypothetical protein